VLLSIIVISHNQKEQLRRYLDSFLAQSIPFEHEIIVSDDASNDGTWELAQEYASKYPQIRAYSCDAGKFNPITPSDRAGWNKCNGYQHATGKRMPRDRFLTSGIQDKSMPRQPSGTGIHHVMMRGINHQAIFEDEEDYYQFITTLDRMRYQYDEDGFPCGTNCTYYAYCLMSNHFHLLIRERDERVGKTIKRIASSYVYYYNRKYGRDGHLFKERFKSEPVNDMAYFTILLRYIHQNPVKAGIVENVKGYDTVPGVSTMVLSVPSSSSAIQGLF